MIERLEGWIPALLAAAVLAVSGCGGDGDGDEVPDKAADAGVTADAAEDGASADVEEALPPCVFADDGSCDEPASCLFGSDAVDCDAACAAAKPPAHLWGACAYRKDGLPDFESVDSDLAARGSNGSGGVYGWDYGTIKARMPYNQGQTRRYYLTWVPDSYDPKRPAPLVYYLGGFGVSMYGVSGWSDLNTTAERNGFIVAYAEQHMRNMGSPINRWMMGWYVYLQAFVHESAGGGTWADNPDADFLVKLTDRLKKTYNIDRTRVFVTGHSRGGGMSVIAPFLRPDYFAGFAGQAAFSHVNKFEDVIAAWKGRHFPGVLVHGTKDDNVKPPEFHATVKALKSGGWLTLQEAKGAGKDKSAESFRPYFVPDVGHRWQPNLNQEWFDFLAARPIPTGEVAP